MVSWTFVAVVLVLAVLGAWLPRIARPVVLAAVSVVAVGAIWKVPVVPLLAATVAVWALGAVLPRLDEHPRSWALAASVGAVVAGLALCRSGGGDGTTLAAPIRVVGVSYVALKFIQHLVDAAAGRAATVDLPAFVRVIFFVPTYASGPIESTTGFGAKSGDPSWTAIATGVERIVFGLGKKFLLADPLLAFAEPAFHDPAAATTRTLLLATYAFALGLYLDFAGYSDIAIGSGQCLGVPVRENFNWPYLSADLATLWQRWHMSFTGWLRDFVFVPVTRRVLRRTKRPLASQVTGQMATMLACGLWHGVAWHYAAWGAYHGIGLGSLSIWRARRGTPGERSTARTALATVATFHFFAFGLVLFACDLRRAAVFASRLLGVGR